MNQLEGWNDGCDDFSGAKPVGLARLHRDVTKKESGKDYSGINTQKKILTEA